MIEDLKIYEGASGAKINVDKTEIMLFGDVGNKQCVLPFKMKEDYIRILGINIGIKEREARDETWAGVLNKIKNTLNFLETEAVEIERKSVGCECAIVVKDLLCFRCVGYARLGFI